MGSYVRQRMSLLGARAGRYLYVVDTDGRLWLGPLAEVRNHSALIPANAQARVAGELRIAQNGDVFVNTQSGHYMRGQQLTQAEAEVFTRAMQALIAEANLTARRVFVGTEPVFQLGN